MKQEISIIRGTTQVLQISVTDANGRAYALGSGEKLLFGVKAKPNNSEYAILKTATSGSGGVYTFKLEQEDTISLPFGRYVYDVGLQSGGNYYNIIQASAFAVLPNVTKWGDGS